ncbi:MAG: hypothetical protein E7065_10685 [Lentimicrobiaceae bacterium]|nr:hypothetical protein [Lentimicrobiaceae bacterium]
MRINFFLIIFTLSFLSVNAQSYNDLWKDLNENLDNRLPQSAETILNKIEQKAVEENNQKELLKSYLYRFRIFELSEEEPLETSINFAVRNVANLQEPERAIFNIAIASLYETYMIFNNNLIKNNIPIYNGKQTTDNGQQTLSMKFWDEATFKRVINKYYENSLNDIESLQNNSAESYKDILAIKDITAEFDFKIEPTLYDYVLHKIIDYKINRSNSVETSLYGISELYQQLIDFDKKNNYNDAAIYNEIKKLKYEYKTTKDYETYFNSLEKIKNENIDNPLVTSVMELQAGAVLSQQSTDNGQQTSSTLAMAIDICDEAIRLFPDSEGAKSCEAIRSEILNKELRFYMQNVQLPDKNISVGLTYKNLSKPHYRIYKVTPEELNYLNKLYHDKKEFAKEIVKKELIVENYIDIQDDKDYIEHTSSYELPGLDCGTYYILFSKDDNFDMTNMDYPAIHSFQVSNLSYVVTKENDEQVIYVLDRDSGKPIKDVNVNIFERNYDYKKREYVKKDLHNLITDRNGCAKFPDNINNQYHIELSKGNDILLSDLYISHYYQNEEKLTERTTFFTDRAIYRPRQTVYFKGIILNENSEKKELVVGKETKVTLRDSNWQEVATQTFTTNEFGSFDGSFLIPENLSNGYFAVSNESGSVNFKVEEYKRPTFEITFNNPDKSFKLNEEVELTGSVKAYAGFGLDNVNYKYTVVRRTYFPYRYWWFKNYSGNEKQIAFGEGTTDEKGNFNISFNLIPDKKDKGELPVYEYIVTVDVTNAQGETQSKTYTLKASVIDLIIDIENQNEFVFKDSLDLINFTVKNLKENPVEAKIIRKIYHVETYGRMSSNGQQTTDNRHLPQDSTLIYEDVIVVNGKYGLFQDVNKNLGIGKYVVELTSADNELAKTSVELTIIDYHSNKMPYETMCISYYDKKTAQPGENVNFYLGSSADDVNVYYMIKYGNEVRHYGRKTISNKILTIPYKLKEEDRGEISFQAFFVKNNTINIVTHEVAIPYENLRLDIRLDVERDNLLPGTEEKWNLTVKNYGDGDESGVANVLTSMYDASLDVFAKNKWNLNVIPETRYSTPPRTDFSFEDFDSEASFKYYVGPGVFDYFLLSMVGITPYSGSPRFAGGGIMYSMMVAEKSSREASNNGDDSWDDAANQEEQNVENQEPLVRENFNETAFFYPNLITNENGSLTFSFTMPDALTRWNLMMLAYTKDLKTGTLNKTFTTSKPLMIMSDMPRFCYENDTLWMVANVIRTTDNGQQSTDFEVATAKLEIFDALTMQPLNLILSDKEIIIDDISEGDSKSVRWKVGIKNDETNLLAFRFSVKTENFSDAEQRLLPILSDEVFMTETYPITVEANSEKTFDFDFNNENERNQGVTLNYCSNPVWYAIQALPYLSQETGEHADVAFNIFYANSLASYIAHNIPNLLNYIKDWNINTPDALMSQLEKDENLKAIMLQETPWVMEAKTEAEQKSRIANLFDVNALRYRTDEVLNLIKEKQSVNGGWSWFPKMPESQFITQYILGGFGRLYKMNVIENLSDDQQRLVDIISDNAADYMRKEIIDDYNYYKNKDLTFNPNSYSINELYSLSFFKSNESEEYINAKSFFIEKLETDWHDLSFSLQAKTALILYREGKGKTAQLIMKSLKERMSQLKNTTDVTTQTLVMEAFKEINPDARILNEMMIGLLNNKRTNMWENARSSVDAIYAILAVSGQSSVMIKVQGSDDIFIQKYWDADEMKNIDNLTIENNSDNIVWGGLFRQYFVSIDEVRKHESPLKVERELFVERVNENGKYLVPIEETELKVGDKVVVNLTIEASQDMEFVFLKDLRAACLEPTEQMSRYNYSDGMLYYQSNSDTYMGFYFDRLPKGKHRVSYSMYVTKEGDFSNGYALIQSLYAPEFSGYSEGMRIRVF